ncbi:MAG: DUF1361 domain-containing protein [Pseudanabaenaceae cyanobacterium bins.39]|nr:DUF1361 domain-containing protein [Pseudanabaenaceae cyanobacterium bins.39]
MTDTFEQFIANFRWMSWNLFLAMIPCILSFCLFGNMFVHEFSKNQRIINKSSPRRGGIIASSRYLTKNPLWWFGLAIFILFLPNAPYIVTDIIHFVNDVRSPFVSDRGIIFLLIPQYTVFILLGFQCYVISVMQLTQYFSRHPLFGNTFILENIIHLLCAIGVYWGRFNRLNSWDVFTNPAFVFREALQNLATPNFFWGTGLFLLTFIALYYVTKLINQAIASYLMSKPDAERSTF